MTIYDLDKIKGQTVMFRLHGKEHRIKPLTNDQFFEYVAAYNHFNSLSEMEKISPEDLRGGYFSLFSSVCKTITREDVGACSQQQAAVIFGIILDAVSGKQKPESDENPKKKTKLVA